MKSLNGEKIKQVEDFKYLRSYIASTKHDVNIRLGKAWDALDELDKIWKSNLKQIVLGPQTKSSTATSRQSVNRYSNKG